MKALSKLPKISNNKIKTNNKLTISECRQCLCVFPCCAHCPGQGSAMAPSHADQWECLLWLVPNHKIF